MKKMVMVLILFLTLFNLPLTTYATPREIYWTDNRTDKIQRSNFDGTEIEDLVSITGELAPRLMDIALDLDAGKMYWIDRGSNHKIQRANLDGTETETLFACEANPYGGH